MNNLQKEKSIKTKNSLPQHNLHKLENKTTMPLWINKGRVFKKVKTSYYQNYTTNYEIRNRYSALEKKNLIECGNNNIIIRGISENILLQERNEMLSKQIDNLMANYEIEKMSKEKMEKYIQSLKKDYEEVLKDGDVKI